MITVHRRTDDGSMPLAIMFAIVMAGLTMILAATTIVGMQKSSHSRDYSLAQQSADVAFADALMNANMGRFDGAATTRSGTGTVNNVTWTWTATKTSGNNWTVNVAAKGKQVDRKFRATLAGSRVLRARHADANGDGVADSLRYEVYQEEFFGNGFFGLDGINALSPARHAVDGYNGRRGILGSNGVLSLSNTEVDQLQLWDWTTDTGRCVGIACSEATIRRSRSKWTESGRVIADRCPAGPYANWQASSGTPLTAGTCYGSLTFNADFSQDPGGMVYATGAVQVTNNVRVNTPAGRANPDARRLRIATAGNFALNPGTKFAGAVYAPHGTCTVNGGTGPNYNTMWMGAGTCKRISFENTTHPARLRYDGGLATVKDAASPATGPAAWTYTDYRALD